ncbi:MAG: ankyrin repeat domain-containing protein [Legionella longbeachae]|nr:ankyrin repeat domain-containing protein [Legionella longbeachae]
MFQQDFPLSYAYTKNCQSESLSNVLAYWKENYFSLKKALYSNSDVKKIHECIARNNIEKIGDILNEKHNIELLKNINVSLPYLFSINYTPIQLANKLQRKEILNLFYSKFLTEVDENDINARMILAARFGHEDFNHYNLSLFSNEVLTEALFHASEMGHITVLERLLNLPNIDMNKPLDKKNNPLSAACEYGHEAAVLLLLKQTAIKVNQPGRSGFKALHYAAGCGYINILLRLMQEPGIDIDCEDNFGDTPLHYAALNGHIRVLEQLIPRSKAFMHRNNTLKMPVFYALEQSHLKCVEILFDQTRDTLCKDEIERILDFSMSRRCKDLSFKIFKQLGVNVIFKEGDTTLIKAIKHSDVETAKALLHEDALTVVGARNSSGNLALHLAAEKGFLEIVQLCFKALPESLNEQDCFSCTPLMHAVRNNQIEVIAWFLTQTQIDYSSCDSYGNSCLHVAARNDYAELLGFLIDKTNLDLNQMNNEGLTPLHTACINQSIDCVELLCKQTKTPIHVTSLYQKQSALHTVIEKDYKAIFNHLMDKSHTQLIININQVDYEGCSLLHFAAAYGRKKMVIRLLAEKEIIINQKNKSDCTPLDLALINNRYDIIFDVFLVHPRVLEWIKRDKSFLDSLFEHSKMHDERMIKFIKQTGIDTNVQFLSGCSLLMAAYKYDYYTMFEELLESNKIKVNMQDYNGNTLLHHIAAKSVSTEAMNGIECLFNYDDLDLSIKNHQQKTALDVAVEKNNQIIEKLILSYQNTTENRYMLN